MTFPTCSSIVPSRGTLHSAITPNSQAICQMGEEIHNSLKRHTSFLLVKQTLARSSVDRFHRQTNSISNENSISNKQKQLINTVLNLQRDKIVKTLESPLCSSELRRILIPIFRDISLLFEKIKQSATLPEVCRFLKMADERISKETDALLAILRLPLVAKFELQWIAIAEYVQRIVLAESGDLAVDSRKQAISESLLAFASEVDFPKNQRSEEITNASIQEFRQKSNQRKAHLLAAASAVGQAQNQEEIDSVLVDLLNKLNRLNYSISPERSLVEKEIFSIPDDLVRLRRQLGETIFRH